MLLGPPIAFARGLRASPLIPSQDSGREPGPLAALPAYLDTLIPAHLGPSATALGVHERILEAARADPRYRKLLVAGCQWLDSQARGLSRVAFPELPQATRVAIVERAVNASPGSGEWVFYQKTRTDAFLHYYADERSWAGVGFAGAPQPAGHPDFAAPPTKRT